jgi:hypothetical protein
MLCCEVILQCIVLTLSHINSRMNQIESITKNGCDSKNFKLWTN